MLGVLEAGGAILDHVLDNRCGSGSHDCAWEDISYHQGGPCIGRRVDAGSVDLVEPEDVEDSVLSVDHERWNPRSEGRRRKVLERLGPKELSAEP